MPSTSRVGITADVCGKKSWHVHFSGNPRAVPVILSEAKNLDRAVFHTDSSLRSE
jgi:hypothetical protein